MTIHINRKTHLIKFECDCCTEILDPDTTDMGEAIIAKAEAGWDSRKHKGSWQHICDHPTCEYPK